MSAAATAPEPRTEGVEALRAEGIVKRFGSITALDGLSIHVDRGEILGILGDNGAGKSTLLKILTGFHQPTEGKLFVDGKAVVLRSVDHARSLGIECVYQDLALVNSLSVFHNMFLNRELRRPFLGLLDHRAMRRRTQEALDDIGVQVPSVDEEISSLSGGQRQAVAVARAVYSKAKILLLDEPLAAMGAREAGLIIDLIARLRQRGDLSIIMIAHNYAQTLEICDRIIMVQHGQVTFRGRAAETSAEALLEIVRREYRAVRRAG
jgi:ABC-type sugar transport system ATPase subunit